LIEILYFRGYNVFITLEYISRCGLEGGGESQSRRDNKTKFQTLSLARKSAVHIVNAPTNNKALIERLSSLPQHHFPLPVMKNHQDKIKHKKEKMKTTT
jgi:hypothetical protein